MGLWGEGGQFCSGGSEGEEGRWKRWSNEGTQWVVSGDKREAKM